MQRDLARKLQMEEKQAQKEKNANNGETKRGSFLSRLTGGRRSRRRSSDTNATEDGDNSNVQEKSGKNKKSKSRGSFGAKLFGGGSLGSEKDGSGSSSSSATAGSGATTTTGSSAAGVEGAGGRKFGGTLLWAPFLSPIVVTIKKDGNVVKINYLQIRAERRSKDIVSSMMHSISEIPKIHTIEISKSHIKAWPKNLREMADLRVIKICQNDMRSVIPDLGRVNDLEELHLEDNLIKAIDPSVFAFERFCNLEVLHFKVIFLYKYFTNYLLQTHFRLFFFFLAQLLS